MTAANQDQKNIRFGIILSYVSLAVSVLGYFFVTRKVLECIGDYQYGLYSFVLSIANWAAIVANALNASYVRFATMEAKQNAGDVGRINALYAKMLLILSLIVLVAGLSVFGGLYLAKVPLFAYGWEDSRTLYLLFALALVNVFFTMLTSVYGLFVNYRKRFIFSRLLALGVSLLGFLAHWLLAYYTKSIVSIAAYSIFATLLTAVGNLGYARKCLGYGYRRANIKENWPLLKQIAIFSGIILFNSVVDQINASVDQIILGAMGEAESVTIYKLAQSLSVYLTTMSVSISSSFVPTINELVVSGKDEELNRLYLRVSKLQAVILCAVTFGFLACGSEFVSLWLKEGKQDVFYVGAALMLMNLCPLTINASIEIQRARNRHLFRAVAYFLVALGNVALSALFLFLFPREKAVYACLLGTVIAVAVSHWIAMNVYNAKAMRLPVLRQMGTLVLYMAVGAACWGCVLALFLIPSLSSLTSHLWRFLIQGFVFVVLYALCLILLNWGAVKARIDAIRAKAKRGRSENEA